MPIPDDATFVHKTLEQCTGNHIKILQLFDFLEEVLRSPSQKQSLSNFIDKWKSCLHTSSQKMMIITYAGTWFPKCLKKLELEKQKSWKDFVGGYDSSFMECTVDSQNSPEFQPLNFKELIRQTFWKEIYEKYGNVIVSHIFDKCAILYEVDEGLHLLIAAPTGNIFKRLLKFDKKPIKRSAMSHTQLTRGNCNPYQCQFNNADGRIEVVIGKENSEENKEIREIPMRDPVFDLEVRTVSNSDGVNIEEPARKKIKLMKNQGDQKQVSASSFRWVRPKVEVIQELLRHRESLLKARNILKTTAGFQQDATPNLTYICIQNDHLFKPKDKNFVIKQKSTFTTGIGTKLPQDWKGLKLPENLSNATSTAGQVLVHVFIISETLARRLNIRIKPKGRQRKKASNSKSVQDAPCLYTDPEVQHNAATAKRENITTLSSRKYVNLQNIPHSPNFVQVNSRNKVTRTNIIPVSAKPEYSNQTSTILAYGLSVTLPILPCLYNRSSWSKWPTSHSLSKAVLCYNRQDKTGCIRVIADDILKTPTCEEAAHHHLLNALKGNWRTTDEFNILNQMILDIMNSYSKFKDIYQLVKSCLHFWQKKIRMKEQQKLKRIGATTNIQPVVSLVSPQVPSKIKNIPGTEIKVVEPTQSTPSTHFSNSDKEHVREEVIPVIDLVNTQHTPSDVTTRNLQVKKKSCQIQHKQVVTPTPRSKYDLLRKCSEDTYKKRTFKRLKYSVPHNCVMQTLKHIFHIMKIDQLLGSKRNTRGFFKFVRKSLILGGVKSNLHLSELMALLHLNDMPLKFITESKLTIAIFTAKLVTWIFNEFLLVLLKTCFYITECNFTRLELRFYLRETWISASHRMSSHLVGKGALNVPNSNCRTANANLRYVPKRNNSLRSLLSMKKSAWSLSKDEYRTMNNLLHYMDAKINKSRMHLPTTLQHTWRKFYVEWISSGAPTLYYLRMDIRDAYPSVSLNKLKEILLNTGGERGHTLTLKTFAVFGGAGMKRIRKSVFDQRNRENWHSGIHVRPCIAVDLGNDKEMNVWRILKQVKDIINTANVVKVGKKIFEFRYGLPQGWGQSPILCSIYYGYIDSTLYLPYIEPKGRLFLRVVDDYLFVSPNANEVLNLMQLMKIGCEKYGITLNAEKSVNNIFIRSDLKAASKICEQITFCGWNFCFTCGHVSRDFNKYNGQDFCSTITFSMPDRVNSPEQFLRLRGTLIVPARVKPILLDPTINCYKRILLTVFEAAVILAFRLYAILRVVYPNLNALKEEERVNVTTQCIHLCCSRLANYAARNVQHHDPNFSSQNQSLCSCDCCGSLSSVVARTEDAVQLTFNNQSPSSIKNILSVNSLMYTCLYGFRLKLLNHFSVFEKVLPKLNGFISRFRRRLGDKHCDNILEIVGNKIPECFSEIRM